MQNWSGTLPKNDVPNGRVTFIETKNGEDRSVRLTERALHILLAIGPKDSGPVFTYNEKPLKDVKTAYDTARKKAGLEDVRFHDLRHTFASHAIQANQSLPVIGAILGHKSPQTTNRYAHMNQSIVQVAANDVSIRLEKVMAAGCDQDVEGKVKTG